MRLAAVLGVLAASWLLTVSADARDNATLLSRIFELPHLDEEVFDRMPAPSIAWSHLERALEATLTGRTHDGEYYAKRARYRLETLTEDGQAYSLLSDQDHIGPTVVLNPNPARDLILETPHPLIDRLTDRQSAMAFVYTGARALILAGANRCAARMPSTCTGRTALCGGKRAYRESDVAHNTESLFHLAHEWLSQRWPNAQIVQLHGFTNRLSPVWFVISDGTTTAAEDSAFVRRVRDQIRSTLGRADRAIICQDEADKGIKSRRICARWNVQGRALNGSADPCTRSTATGSGRFAHIEQVYGPVRRAFASGRFEAALDEPGSRAILDALRDQSQCLGLSCRPTTSP